MVRGLSLHGGAQGTAISRAVIVAAGRGSRMGPLTRERPKCLLPLGERTLLDRALDILRRCGVRDISVVRGFRKELLTQPGVRWFDNPDYEHTNILASLWCAREAFAGGFLFVYSDIVFTEAVIQQALQDPADIGIVMDRQWRLQYEGRHAHDVSEAELVQAEPTGSVRRIGKHLIAAEEATGEFIGIARLSPRGAEIFRTAYEQLLAEGDGRPLHQAKGLEAAYFTDIVQHLVDGGHRVSVIPIDGGWQEIDTQQDYERAQRRWTG